MRPKQEILDEKSINAAWMCISHAPEAKRTETILFYAEQGTEAVKAWVETKFRATLAELRK
jgi:hypothetical protein